MAHPDGSLMMNRRDMVAGCVAAAAVPLALEGMLRAIPPGRGQGRIEPFRILYEGTAAPGPSFARAAARLGGEVREIRGDMTRVWYEEIAPRWRREAAAVAGLTAPGALFCFEQLAWEWRMRVVYRDRLSAAAASSDSVGERLGQLVMSMPARVASAPKPVVPALHDLQRGASALFLWVIAPLR
jgi:hypothetical protein